MTLPKTKNIVLALSAVCVMLASAVVYAKGILISVDGKTYRVNAEEVTTSLENNTTGFTVEQATPVTAVCPVLPRGTRVVVEKGQNIAAALRAIDPKYAQTCVVNTIQKDLAERDTTSHINLNVVQPGFCVVNQQINGKYNVCSNTNKSGVLLQQSTY